MHGIGREKQAGLERNVFAASGFPLCEIDPRVMQHGQQIGPDIPDLLAAIQIGQGPFQGFLDQVVGVRRVRGKGPGIAAQGLDVFFQVSADGMVVTRVLRGIGLVFFRRNVVGHALTPFFDAPRKKVHEWRGHFRDKAVT